MVVKYDWTKDGDRRVNAIQRRRRDPRRSGLVTKRVGPPERRTTLDPTIEVENRHGPIERRRSTERRREGTRREAKHLRRSTDVETPT